MRARLFGGLGLIILAVLGILAYLSLFVIQQTEQALVLRFGEPVRVITSPGLYAKLPLVDNIEVFDKRILDLDSPPLEIIASDQKRLVVDAFGRYRIIDALRFFQSVGTVAIADQRLSVLLNSAVRQVLGEATFESVVRDERSDLMSRINERVNREGQSLGIEIVDVRIRRADLPEANSQAIYQRMQTEREREATEIRAQGEQAARRIRAEADRTATVIVAEANRESEQIRGDGDAERTNIFAEAYGRDPEFFDFYRSMQAYQVGLKPNATRMLLSPDTEFFRYFNSDAAPSGGGNSVPGETAVEPSAESTDAGQAPSNSQSSAAANSDANSSPETAAPATTMTDVNQSGATQDNSGSEAAPASTQ
jgi:membrane protease subunit HflC